MQNSTRGNGEVEGVAACSCQGEGWADPESQAGPFHLAQGSWWLQ